MGERFLGGLVPSVRKGEKLSVRHMARSRNPQPWLSLKSGKIHGTNSTKLIDAFSVDGETISTARALPTIFGSISD
jgi:hypothetical protein